MTSKLCTPHIQTGETIIYNLGPKFDPLLGRSLQRVVLYY